MPTRAFRAQFLIASGDKPTLHSVRKAVRLRGHDAVAVETLEAAQLVLKASPVDAFICDVTMPDGYGVSALYAAERTFGVLPVALIGADLENDFHPDIYDRFTIVVGPPPFEFEGLFRSIDLHLRKPCPDCHGAGSINLLTSRVLCTRCEGTGHAPKVRST